MRSGVYFNVCILVRIIVRENRLNVVVGVGGGSAIDTAKATAHYEKLPVVIIPTVVATDAPCTGLSVIYNDDETFNSYLFYPKNPEAVIVDSDVIAKSPVKFLVAGCTRMGQECTGIHRRSGTCALAQNQRKYGTPDQPLP